MKNWAYDLTEFCGQFRVSNLPRYHVFGVWEETEALGVNPRRHGENMKTPYRKNWDLL